MGLKLMNVENNFRLQKTTNELRILIKKIRYLVMILMFFYKSLNFHNILNCSMYA